MFHLLAVHVSCVACAPSDVVVYEMCCLCVGVTRLRVSESAGDETYENYDRKIIVCSA